METGTNFILGVSKVTRWLLHVKLKDTLLLGRKSADQLRQHDEKYRLPFCQQKTHLVMLWFSSSHMDVTVGSNVTKNGRLNCGDVLRKLPESSGIVKRFNRLIQRNLPV